MSVPQNPLDDVLRGGRMKQAAIVLEALVLAASLTKKALDARKRKLERELEKAAGKPVKFSRRQSRRKVA